MTDDLTARLRSICMALPEVTERPSHGTPSWFVRDKKMFATIWFQGHHDDKFPHMWCAAPLGAQEESIEMDPGRFFRPPYVGHRGWLGIRLDGDVDWEEIDQRCEEAFRVIAPKTLVRRLDEAQ